MVAKRYDCGGDLGRTPTKLVGDHYADAAAFKVLLPLRPFPRAVINAQHLDGLLLLVNPVDSDVGQGREQDFSCAFLASRSPTVGRLSQ